MHPREVRKDRPWNRVRRNMKMIMGWMWARFLFETRKGIWSCLLFSLPAHSLPTSIHNLRECCKSPRLLKHLLKTSSESTFPSRILLLLIKPTPSWFITITATMNSRHGTYNTPTSHNLISPWRLFRKDRYMASWILLLTRRRCNRLEDPRWR